MTANQTLALFIGGPPLGLFLLYVVVRVGAAAYFKSKQQFDTNQTEKG